MNRCRLERIVALLALLAGCAVVPALRAEELPALHPDLSPLAEANRPLLRDRLVAAFGRDYAAHHLGNVDRPLCEGMTVYFLRRELQALVDMWRGTGRISYLDHARSLTLRAIEEATANRRPLLLHGQDRGDRPCFYLETVAAKTGGHNQLCDFQGGAGFLVVARAMHQIHQPGWRDIAGFVEREIVEKWLLYRPSVTRESLAGAGSDERLLTVLNSARDAREHFACICLDLHAMGYRRYPYRQWATLLVDLYLTPRRDADRPPQRDELASRIPADWGLLVRTTEEGHTSLSVPNYDPNHTGEAMDTSHANRTAWLAARACDEGLIDESVVRGLVATLRFRIWAPEKGPFYFNNYVDGTDTELDGLGPGRGGNVWFGWHRLSAYDPALESLFLSIAYDLTNGGPNLPAAAQNRIQSEAPLCLQAWAVRLLADNDRPLRFP